MARIPAWMLDEAEHAGRENPDLDHVARYDSKEDADAVEEVDLLRDLGLSPDSTVVELGPGTGQFALAAAPHCARVVAVDVSPPMLERLRTKCADRAQDNVEIIEAGFLTYEHTGPPADFVYSRLALHHLPDMWKALALRRMHELLRPDGVLRLVDVVYPFEPEAAPGRIETWCRTGQDVAPGTPIEDGWGRWEIEEHVRDEHSTFSWLLEPMIERAGFTIETATHDDRSLMVGYVLRSTPPVA